MQDAAHLDVQQNLDAQNLDAIPPFLDVVHQFPVNQLVVAVVVELRHQLKMDCYLDVVDAELRRQKKMDCFLDEVLELLALKLKKVVLHHFLPRDRRLHALQPLLYVQSP